MNILVLLRMVPDVVEELEVAADGKTLDASVLRMILNERDDHALEQALILKERHGGTVTLVSLDTPEIDDVLFTAMAKGADRAVKITGVEGSLSTAAAAHRFAKTLPTVAGVWPADLALTGVQAIDDLDGWMAPLLARLLNLAYVGVVTRVTIDASLKTAVVLREYAGGVRAELDVALPAILGIQAAEKPPRYVPVAKVRAAMKSKKIESIGVQVAEPPAALEVLGMAKPQTAGHAEMLAGSSEEIAATLCDIFAKIGLTQGR